MQNLWQLIDGQWQDAGHTHASGWADLGAGHRLNEQEPVIDLQGASPEDDITARLHTDFPAIPQPQSATPLASGGRAAHEYSNPSGTPRYQTAPACQTSTQRYNDLPPAGQSRRQRPLEQGTVAPRHLNFSSNGHLPLRRQPYPSPSQRTGESLAMLLCSLNTSGAPGADAPGPGNPGWLSWEF